ncbi:hypothetical protein [Petrotoga halophila]|uniref:Uncharacterized protein n=1 Tax=Petrotoga halophila DSM 16923 TaxID=1122953 RepID=A0A2S5EG92_9BACT|nr:hypothetical protein [Petrotoga halophila]POZ92151.1 hypothetical protein AA81_08685 [Petrotoga halophila DSM 16923]
MFFQRKITINQANLSLDIHINFVSFQSIKYQLLSSKTQNLKIKTIDINELVKIKELPWAEGGITFIEETDQLLPKKIINFDFIKISIIKNSSLSGINIKDSEIKIGVSLINVPMSTNTTLNTTKMIEFNIKESTPQKIVIKPIRRVLKRPVSKEYILQLAQEIASSKKLQKIKLSFLGFYVKVPIAEEINYYWKGEKLICFLKNNKADITDYFDCAVFFDSENNKKYLKFIRR